MMILLFSLFLQFQTSRAESISFVERPTHLTSNLTEYESTDRAYAIQEFSVISSNKLVLYPQGLAHARVFPPVEVTIDGNTTKILRNRQGLESVAEYLLRHLILHIETKDLTTVSFDRDIHLVAIEENQKKISAAYNELLNLGYECNSFNLFVRYADREKTTIAEIVFEPPANGLDSNSFNKEAISTQAMIQRFSQELSDALKSTHYPYQARHFADIQKDETNILRKNVAGRNLRIAGIDENYNQFLTSHIEEQLKKMGYTLVEAYYFGSRVMTRDVLLKLDPEIVGFLDVGKGKLIKNHVRESGLTSVSDIEIFLVTKPIKAATGDSMGLNDPLRDRLRNSLNTITRRYSLGMKILMVDGSSKREEYFTAIRNEIFEKKKGQWLMSPEQFVKFYPPPRPTIFCSKLFQ